MCPDGGDVKFYANILFTAYTPVVEKQVLKFYPSCTTTQNKEIEKSFVCDTTQRFIQFVLVTCHLL